MTNPLSDSAANISSESVAKPDPGPSTASTAEAAPWPTEGAVRVHRSPGDLPHQGDEPGPHRFDDPRPRTIERFLIRYAASTLRGCLLELLAHFRDNPEAAQRERQVDCDDPDLFDPPDVESWQHIHDYLVQRKVATIHATAPMVMSIHDPALQHDLDQEPAVRAILDTDDVRSVLLETRGHRVHLDNAAVRLASPIGRYITQACALALHDRPTAPDAIHYRSRHDDNEDCWAIYHHTPVAVEEGPALSPSIDDHAHALASVAELWDLPLGPEWLR